MREVSLAGTIKFSDSDLEAVLAELPRHIQLSREEPGCIEFNVTQDSSTPTLFHVAERFESNDAFTRHQLRVRASNWGTITKDAKRRYTVSGLDAS